jgi:undecaprenyl-diphosphatase
LGTFLQYISQIDERILRWVRSHKLPPSFHKLFQLYTRIGDGYFWGVIALLIITLLPHAQWREIVTYGVGAEALSLLIYWILKLTVRRPRPFNAFADIDAEVPPLDTFSFPSGHTMNNLAPATVIAMFFPWVGILAIFVPLSWGIFRIYYGVHYMSDVVFGFLLGAMCGLLSFTIIPMLGLL